MDAYQKIEALKALIDQDLRPLITGDYRLLEIPDYPNVGDVLIFQGEIDFLRSVEFRCKEMSTMSSFGTRLPKIPESDLLILSGGGYFGDLWPRGPNFQARILELYPKNPILILPQSVYFADKGKLESAIRRYGEHSNLRICLRDRASYEFIRNNFKNEAYLIPDMAFYANVPQRKSGVSCDRELLLMRNDKELLGGAFLESLRNMPGIEVSDWPSMRVGGIACKVMNFCRSHPRHVGRFSDLFSKYVYRRALLRSGIRFISPYAKVYSTRLHGCILSLLMGKDVVMIDNSYGKNSHLYETWLSDCDNIKLVE